MLYIFSRLLHQRVWFVFEILFTARANNSNNNDSISSIKESVKNRTYRRSISVCERRVDIYVRFTMTTGREKRYNRRERLKNNSFENKSGLSSSSSSSSPTHIHYQYRSRYTTGRLRNPRRFFSLYSSRTVPKRSLLLYVTTTISVLLTDDVEPVLFL